MKLLLPLAATLALTTTASAVPNHGFDFRIIGDPGNPPTDPSVYHPNFPRPLGGIDYEFRLTRTEVTYTQQLEFMTAYAPHYFEDGGSLGDWGELRRVGISGGAPIWEINEGAEKYPAMMSPRLWARYCNWLHNDKALTREAFDSGAYETSTFGRNEDGTITDQMRRSDGAKFWIPSIEEWTKGGYWDPNKNGEGEGGYWLAPNSSDTRSIPGHPDEGGETNAGPGSYPMDVGSYPDTQTPWGLLDYSGGGRELAERIGSFSYLMLGSEANFPGGSDGIGRFFVASPDTGFLSLRLASAVPAPGASVFLVAGISALTRRRR